MRSFKNFFYDYFSLGKHNTSVRTEFLAGVTNYFTLIYAVMLVPDIIVEAFGLINGDVSRQMLIALTAISFIAAGLGSIFIGLFVNLPFVQGPSVAIATFITYTVCKGFGYSYNQALAMVFISGILFFILDITGMEERIHKSIPNNLKYAVSTGIGLLVAMTGLAKAHIINFDSKSSYAHIFSLDFSNSHNISAILAIFMVFVIVIMLKRHIHGAIFIGKILCIIIAIPLGLVHFNKEILAEFSIDFSFFAFKMDFAGLFDFSSKEGLYRSLTNVIIIVLSLCIMNIFETMSMFIAMDNYVAISHDGVKKKRNVPRILEADAITTALGASIGSPTVSTYVESTTGVIEGGRTGLTAVITGVLFILTVPFTPLVSLVPSAATATTLIVAGVMMMGVAKLIDFENITEAVPAFLAMFLMPITNSVLIGTSMGVISYVLIHVFVKKEKLSPFLYFLGFVMVIAFAILPR